jgi:DNA-binding response OmpR family regulator
MDMALDGGRTLQTVVACHSNKMLAHLGKLHAERQGLRVILAKNGDDVLLKAKLNQPDLIVLSNDLQKPSTEETVAMLEREPTLKGIRVVIVKGALPNVADMLRKIR